MDNVVADISAFEALGQGNAGQPQGEMAVFNYTLDRQGMKVAKEYLYNVSTNLGYLINDIDFENPSIQKMAIRIQNDVAKLDNAMADEFNSINTDLEEGERYV
jgi:hypothetical protein